MSDAIRYPRETLVDLNREVEMMGDPDRWPAWPYLPLKKPGTREFAYLAESSIHDSPDHPGVTCRQGLMPTANINPTDKGGDPVIEFTTFTDLVNAGWRVD